MIGFLDRKRFSWFQHWNNCIITILDHFPPTATVFDTGGGNGCVTSAIQFNPNIILQNTPGETWDWEDNSLGTRET